MLIPDYNPKNTVEYNELPDNIKEMFEKSLNENREYRNLLRQVDKAKRRNNLFEVINYYQKLNEIRLIAQANLIQRQGEEKVTLLSMGLSHEQLDKINILTIAMYMACDMLEFFALDINSELRKIDETARFEMFDPILKIGKEARDNLKYLWKNTSMYDTEDFNNHSDNMRELLINKAKKVYVKYAKVVSDKEAEKARKEAEEIRKRNGEI